MGQAESHPSGGDTSASTSTANAAFHVLRVAENSPAAEAGIEPCFDFVVGAGGKQLGDEIDLLTDVLEANEGRQVSLQVYSTKRKEVREVRVVPSRTWSSAAVPGGETGAVDGQPSLLGLSLRLCDPQHALEQVWHVLEILQGSPAQSAGLVPYGDWIVGYAGGVLRGEGDFYDIVESHVDKPLRLFVYNSDYDVLREVILVPNRSWGGDGLLGCGVGYGLLHRIPKPQDRARQAPPPAAVGQQFQPTYAPPPPPSTSSPASAQNRQADRLTSFLNQSGVPPAQNPLYAPPPPRSSGATATPPRANARPQPPPIMAAPPPPRRTAALAYDDDDDDDDDEQHQNSYGGDGYGSSSRNYDSSYGSEHPSFSRYGDDGGYGAYDASDGVEVVPVEVITEEGDEDEHEASFVSSASGRGGPAG